MKDRDEQFVGSPRQASVRERPIRITVITVCRNAAATLEATIQSVITQRYAALEYIVIDGASTDGTLELLQRHEASIDRLISEPDSGIYAAMNKGAGLATGEVVYFLNADDVFCDESVLEDIAAVFADRPSTDIVFGEILRDHSGTLVPYPQCPKVSRRTLCRSTICHQAIFARRELFDVIGGFDERNRVVSDGEWLYLACTKARATFHHIPRNIAIIGTEGASYSLDWKEEKRRSLRKYYTGLEILIWRDWPREHWPRIKLRLRQWRNRVAKWKF